MIRLQRSMFNVGVFLMLDEGDYVVVYGCEPYQGSHPSDPIRGLGSFQMGGNCLLVLLIHVSGHLPGKLKDRETGVRFP